MQQLRQWKRVLILVKDSVIDDRLIVVAPGVAYFLMLGLLPGLAALVLIYGLVADPAQIHQQFEALAGAMPPAAAEILSVQIQRVAEARTTAGWGAAISIGFALWAGSYALGVIVAALNITFNTEETRGFIELTVLRVVLTIGVVGLGLVAMAMLVLVPPILDAVGLTDGIRGAVMLVRWPILFLLGVFGLAMLYRYAPDRPRPAFRLLSWGSAIAAVLWVIGSSAFSFYVTRFDVYDELFGALATVVILMLWLLLSSFAILLGAEIDSVLDREAEGEAD